MCCINNEKRKLISSAGICLLNGQRINSLEKEDGYNYLGILEADGVKHKQMKEMTRKNTFAEKLNGGRTCFFEWQKTAIFDYQN